MRDGAPIVITLPGGRRVDAAVGNHLVHTDQPIDHGGEDTAVSPFQLFLAAIGTCAGVFVESFCAKRQISTEGIRIIALPELDSEGLLFAVGLDLQLPPSFPEKYLNAIAEVVEHCTVKRSIQASPAFHVHVSRAEHASAGAPPH